MSDSVAFAGLGARTLRFLHWWKRELISVVPRFVRDLTAPKTIALTLRSDTIELVQDRRRGARLLASARLEDERTVTALVRRAKRIAKVRPARLGLRLVRGQCLVRNLTLPIATVSRQHAMVGLEVERTIPRETSDVAYAWAADDARIENGQVPVDLLIVKRSVLEEALDRLAGHRLRPDFIDCWRDEKSSYRVDFLATPSGGPGLSSGWWRLKAALAIACVALLLTAPVLWNLHRGDVLAAVEVRVDQARVELQEARASVELADARDTAVAALRQRRMSRPLMIEIWAELARLLPDDAYAEEVTVADRQIVVVGRAKAAAALIPALEISPLFKEAGLSSSVVLDAESGLEQFTIRLVLEQAPETAAIQGKAAIQ